MFGTSFDDSCGNLPTDSVWTQAGGRVFPAVTLAAVSPNWMAEC